MKTLPEIRNARGILIRDESTDGMCGYIYLGRAKGIPLTFVASWGGGWEHVSASYPNKLPTWDEMCRVKDIFWNDEECAIQYHPPKSNYVNNHPYCLHIWKPIGEDVPMPPKGFV